MKISTLILLSLALCDTLGAHYISKPQNPIELPLISPMPPAPAPQRAARSTYSFNKFVRYNIDVVKNGRRRSNNTSTFYETSINSTEPYFGINTLQGDGSDNAGLDYMIIDLPNEQIVMFMGQGGKKTQMAMHKNLIDDDNPIDRIDDWAQYDIQSVSELKTIAGYKCQGYRLISDNDTTITWISTQRIPDFPYILTMIQNATMQQRKSRGSQDILWQYPDIVERIQAGHAMLGYENSMRGGRQKVYFEITEWGDRNYTFDASQYEYILE